MAATNPYLNPTPIFQPFQGSQQTADDQSEPPPPAQPPTPYTGPYAPQAGQMPLAQFSGGAAPYGQLSTDSGGVALMGIDPKMLASNQMASLYDGTNPVVQAERQAAMNFAAARGAGLDSSQYADTATQAAIAGMSPIAAADAGVYQNVAAANQTALNQNHLAGVAAEAQTRSASISAGAMIQANHERVQEDQRQYDIGQQNRLQNRDWQLADARTAAISNQRASVFNAMLSSLVSDPSALRDPVGMMGALNYFTKNINDLMDPILDQVYPKKP